MKINNTFISSLVVALSYMASSIVSAKEPTLIIKADEKIAFLGDSITEAGNRKGGYVQLVMQALNQEGLNLTHVPAGIAGHRSPDMLTRLEKDVISKKPDWMILSCGVNDVWHFSLTLGGRGFTGVPLEDYKKNIRGIIEKSQAANIKILVLTSTMIGEDPEKETNKKLIPYNNFLREIAKEKDLPVADLSRDMHELVKKMPDEVGKAMMFGEPEYTRNIKNKLTFDGCHMNDLGNMMMAKGVLKALGLSDVKIAAAEKAWLSR